MAPLFTQRMAPVAMSGSASSRKLALTCQYSPLEASRKAKSRNSSLAADYRLPWAIRRMAVRSDTWPILLGFCL